MSQHRDKRGRFVKSRAPVVLDDICIIVIELERRTGDVKLDDEFSTPAETFAACYRALQIAQDRLDKDHGDDD